MTTELSLSVIGNLDKAKALVKEANLTQAKEIISEAEALRTYAEQANKGLEIQNQCAEIKIRAERRAGELLKRLERNTPQTANPTGLPMSNNGHGSEYGETLKELKTTRQDAQRWQLESSIPEEKFEQFITETKANAEELTSHAAIAFAAKIVREERQQSPPVVVVPPAGKYRTIVIDPPWPIEKIERDVRPNQITIDYPTMTLEEIRDKVNVSGMAFEDGCHVYLWVTHKHLPDGLWLFREWGVNYQCLLTWVKNVGITPYSWMYSTEHVLFGRIGSLQLLQLGKRLDFAAKVREHSRKPEIFYEIVKEVSPEPRIDMFAREPHGGFETWGNETSKF